jgi:hypothetical protein
MMPQFTAEAALPSIGRSYRAGRSFTTGSDRTLVTQENGNGSMLSWTTTAPTVCTCPCCQTTPWGCGFGGLFGCLTCC